MMILKGILLYFTIFVIAILISGIDFFLEYTIECAILISVLGYICYSLINKEELKRLLFYKDCE